MLTAEDYEEKSCPMCDWSFIGPKANPMITAIYAAMWNTHIDLHCDSFAREMDTVIPSC